MVTILAAAMTEGAVWSAPAADLGRGAIAGAFIAAAAFLAGYAAIRRSGLAVCALMMVVGAAALEFSWLGFLAEMQGNVAIFIMGLFAAAAIIFLSATISAAKYNPLLGGVMFTAALIIAGMGAINFVDRIEIAQLIRWCVVGVGGFAVFLALSQALRGDMGARLILPGIAIALAAPIFGLGPIGSADAVASLAPHGLFTLGILAASLVALTESGIPVRPALAQSNINPAPQFTDVNEPAASHAVYAQADKERVEIVLDSSLARVLDYSGVAIWDWMPEKIEQTESLPLLLGADSTAPFTPEAMSNFIAKEDLKRFKSGVICAVDGPFDIAMKLFDGRKVRMRGARALDESTGELTRILAFIETASPIFKPAGNNGVNGMTLQAATAAAIVPVQTSALASKMVGALENGDIVAAFQPIVSLDDKKTVGYETLARWRGQTDDAGEGPETFVKAAEQAGRGGELAGVMLEQAASFLADKLSADRRGKYFVAMNVSWGQMRDSAFAEQVRDVIQKYRLPKNSLVLELTEGDAVSDGDNAGAVFSALKKAGAALAFDDFGAGFSCLSNLRKYDFDYLKIDKSFAADLEAGGDGAKIVAALASLGKDLGLKVIVEGIETKTAARVAHKMGLPLAQGYAFGKPEEMLAPPPPEALVEPAPEIVLAAAPAAKTPALADEDTPSAETGVTVEGRQAGEDEETELALTSELAADTAALDNKQGNSWLWRRGSLR